MTGQHLRLSLVLANDVTIDLIAVGSAACGKRPVALTPAEQQLAVGQILIAHAQDSNGKPFAEAGQLAAARERARRMSNELDQRPSQMEHLPGHAELSCTGALPR